MRDTSSLTSVKNNTDGASSRQALLLGNMKDEKFLTRVQPYARFSNGE